MDKNEDKNNKEKKTIIDKLKGISVLVIVFGIGEIVGIVDSKWVLYGFILLLVALFFISLFLTIRNSIINLNNKKLNRVQLWRK